MKSETNLQQAAYRVEGLDCAEEVSVLRARLGTQPGIRQLEFDVIRSRMLVEFEPAAISTEGIVRLVAGTGMRAVPADSVSAQETQVLGMRCGPLLTTCAAGLLAAMAFVIHGFSSDFLSALGYPPHRVPLVAAGFYLLSILFGVWYVVPKAYYAVRGRRADMNLLMCLAVLGALALDEWFEAATVSFLFSLALLLEHWSMRRARRAIAGLMNLSPATARCRSGADGSIETRPVKEVEVGTTVLVRPGERIPLDGDVIVGQSHVDQAPITGESIAVFKQPGAPVYAGTINVDGAFELVATRHVGDTTLARIIHMVERAQARRAPSEQWVDRFARYYTPVILALALALAVIPPLVLRDAWSPWAYNALVLLVIACPCALVISTPVSIISALTAAARRGVLIKGGLFLEACASLPSIAVDKTGTLTCGQPAVHQITPLDGRGQVDLLRTAAALEAHSTHPIARAILQKAEEEGIVIQPADNYREIDGLGAEATISGHSFWVGSPRLARQRMKELMSDEVILQESTQSVVVVGDSEKLLGLIGVSDQVREGAAVALRSLRALGTRHICMLTGDNEPAARRVAELTGVDEFMADALPADKVARIEAIRQRFGSVAMIGDGVNDSPAMAASDLGIAMGAIGTDVAIETADIALMSDDLARLPWLVTHACRTLSVVRQNIVFAIGLKLLFVVFAVLGVASLWMAIAADMGASLLVICNGLRLLK